MSRGLDHIVHAVPDLDAAADVYRRLGFLVGARNRHPPQWGTHNRIVQLPGFFVELLTVAEPAGIAPPAPRSFGFGAFNRDYLAQGEGFSMLALESRDAEHDAQEFGAAGIGDFDPVRFERDGRRPDGSVVKVGFALAFARDRRAPLAGFFVCQQLHPENFWDPAFQAHANTACAVAGIVLVADNPTDHHIFLSAFAGERELQATSTGVSIATSRGAIAAMDPAAFRIHFAVEPPEVRDGARLAALRFFVRDLDATRAMLTAGAIPWCERMGLIVVGPQHAIGATIVFEAGGPEPP